MTYQELAAEIMGLPVDQRISLLALVSRSVHDDLQARPNTASLVAQLRGSGKPDGPVPTDAEIEDEYTTYLERKYA